MISLVNFIGARPQIIKAAAISRVLRSQFQEDVREVIVHTGQHYDKKLSQVFFDEMNIPRPDVNLGVGSGPHGKQTGLILAGTEKYFDELKPDVVVVYGDTNSTLAGALAAAKLHIPVVHVEAGMRSFNKFMPEEINRISTDHLSTLLFSPTDAGFKNLIREGFLPENVPPFHINNPKIYHCGDIMYDNAIYFGKLAEEMKSSFLTSVGVEKNGYILATIHRENNTDDPIRLNDIFKSLYDIVEKEKFKIVLPLHPRTEKAMKQMTDKNLYNKIKRSSRFIITEPVSYLEMILLEKNAALIMTDSGGVQKEAHFYHRNCLVFRDETEWTELVSNGTAILVDADPGKIVHGFRTFMKGKKLSFPEFYGDGHAATFICNEIINSVNYT